MRPNPLRSLCLAATFLAASAPAATRQMENLDRGLVAVKVSGGVFVGWRVLGTDPAGLGFNLYRDGAKVNTDVITGATNLVDAAGTTSSVYTVKPVRGGEEQAAGGTSSTWASQVRKIALDRPAGGSTPAAEAFTYSPSDIAVGDLDGDGAWDLVVKWDPSNGKDNSQSGYTGNVILDAYTLAGKRLWRIDLGRNIRAGAHYTQVLVGDYDGDGKAEVACKTAPGTKDATGAYLAKGPAASDNDAADYRNTSGYILSGPEYLTVFAGPTGRELATANYVPARGSVDGWGDGYGNRVDRFLATNAYLDGVKPSMVFQRGYYTRMALTAWDWDGTTLKQRWAFDNNSSYKGQGNHNLSAGDVDGDGFDEIVQGSAAIDHNGVGMYTTGLGHGDAIHMGDLDPDNPGLEVWEVHEDVNVAYGHELHDARTGRILWGTNYDKDNGRGMSGDIDAASPGHEMWSSAGAGVYSCKGKQLSTSKPSVNFRVYWDGDLLDELLDGSRIDKWTGDGTNPLITLTGVSCNGTKATPNFSGDLLGDWREEVILHDDANLYVHTTTIPTSYRLYTLAHDPVYRLGMSWQNAAYNQPPHLGFWLGAGIDKAPRPDIALVGGEPPVPVDCHGTENGKAALDSCGRCVDGTTGLSACSGWLEGEGFCSADGIAETTNPGSHDGYLNLANEVGSSATWMVEAATTGPASLAFLYANGGGADRTVSVSVNGESAVASQSFPATSSWSDWKLSEAPVTLLAGRNTIRIRSLTADGAANIDRIGLVGTGVSKANCVALSASDRLDFGSRRSGMVVDLSSYGDPSRLSATAHDLRGNTRTLTPRGNLLDLRALPGGLWIVEIRDGRTLVAKSPIVRM